jgi:ElaB/YqjD/DUF883 family membrane-anchored ribosome-binding protein
MGPLLNNPYREESTMDTMEKIEQSRENLMRSLKSVIEDTEKMLENTAQQAGDGLKNAKAKLESTLDDARWELGRLEDAVVGKTKDAMECTDRYVKANPWQAVGIGAAVGVLVGMLMSRK